MRMNSKSKERKEFTAKWATIPPQAHLAWLIMLNESRSRRKQQALSSQVRHNEQVIKSGERKFREEFVAYTR